MAANNMCDYGVFIGIRGTDTPAGAGAIHGGRAYNSGGYGGVEVLRSHLINFGTVPLYFVALNYPASGGASFFGSVRQGRNTLVDEINWLVEQCGSYTPAIVIVGYSQGGAVALAALTTAYDGSPNLAARARVAIMAVADIADPYYVPNKAYNAPNSTTTGWGRLGGILTEQQEEIASYRYWGWPPPGGTQGWVYKVRSWCSTDDYWCAGSDGPNAAEVHANAGTDNAWDAKEWIQYLTTSF
ncbi:cutinase family protein [Microbacterium rhizomatis]|uniref:cutinase family protein n=1 Tax=Microbacterium rhizomatis TaxID=1631477 RepID=UPI0014792CFF|nr:cutinase family protein [Microbacterium rhizomatis]